VYANSHVKGLGKLIAFTVLLLAGCQNVEPWERDRLAEPAMQLSADITGSKLDQQVFFSKEAASGGTSAAGGGCVCN